MIRSLEIDDELEPGRLHGGKVGGLGAPENTAGIDAGLARSLRQLALAGSPLSAPGTMSPLPCCGAPPAASDAT